MEVEFTIAGFRRHLSTEDVIRKLRGVKPGVIRTHAVRVQGVQYPIKQAFALIAGLDPLDFNTNQARTLFKRLGFEVTRRPR